MKIFLPAVGMILTLVLVSYLESPYSVVNKEHVQVSGVPYEVLMADAEAQGSEPIAIEEETNVTIDEESEEVAAQNYSLDMVLEETTEIDGYIVETYREYEIYKDNKGKIIKKVPTSNYDYLRYEK
ncbi:hypothetical protein JMM81_18235 [Bacillus sp. V3B]|uniref:hypothetical protein n=1 Tax=Bacillus sp. V3B TaxID=2804915 RepID=UPI00210A8A99|nr:hypothetical protein [Bacillus sp. V3B]MCQ6276826.1 hypothetical protein [Bacillus sp. V3B]